ncbi:hypothetical protein EDB89DRAFT_1915207 [Lactarius sanguifluus]|nr:hypothetical protein EDB89DRAFT_1915207 [Lactarius sanguifluus]
MSWNPQDPGHAVRPDGTLKDTSEMSWTYDADESVPFPQSLGLGAAGGQGAALKPQVAKPVRVSSPDCVRRSGRMLCLSRRVLEAAEASSGSPARRVKRKAPSASTMDRHVVPKTVNLDDVSSCRPYEADDNGNSSVGPTRDVDDLVEPQVVGNLMSNDDDEPIDEPTMADAGHEVCRLLSPLFCTSR